MSKKTYSFKRSNPAGCSWAKDPGFTSSQSGDNKTMQKNNVPVASPTGELKPLLEELLSNLINTVNASAGIIRLFTRPDQTPWLLSSVGLPAELLKNKSILDLPCEAESKIFDDSGIYYADLRACVARKDCLYSNCWLQSIIIAQIASHDVPKVPVGTLSLFFNETNESCGPNTKIILAFAQMLATCIAHYQYNRDAKRADLIAERQGIANEIHDSLAQTLVYTRMRTSMLLESIRTGNEVMAAKYAHDVDEALESSQKTVRELITDFRCEMDPDGLIHALQTLVDQFRHRNAIVLEYLNRVANLELPLEHEIQIYHIIQEALANIAHHSGATHARLSVEYSRNYYAFTIEDNGVGGCAFPTNKGHYGMMIMHERAQRIGGKIIVESPSGIGTRVQLLFPEPGVACREFNE